MCQPYSTSRNCHGHSPASLKVSGTTSLLAVFKPIACLVCWFFAYCCGPLVVCMSLKTCFDWQHGPLTSSISWQVEDMQKELRDMITAFQVWRRRLCFCRELGRRRAERAAAWTGEPMWTYLLKRSNLLKFAHVWGEVTQNDAKTFQDFNRLLDSLSHKFLETQFI